jgi:hypothetical protein
VNLHRGFSEAEIESATEPEGTTAIGSTGWEDTVSSKGEEVESLWSMDKKEPTEASPSCNEVREIAASSRLDRRPGYNGWDYCFFRTARGTSSCVHLRLECWITGEGERIRLESGGNGSVGEVGRSAGLVYGWNLEKVGEWQKARGGEVGEMESVVVGGGDSWERDTGASVTVVYGG